MFYGCRVGRYECRTFLLSREVLWYGVSLDWDSGFRSFCVCEEDFFFYCLFIVIYSYSFLGFRIVVLILVVGVVFCGCLRLCGGERCCRFC